MEMNANKECLHSLLFEEGRELENIKFFPGDDRGLSASSMCEEAAKVIRAAMMKGLIDKAPSTGRAKSTI